MHSFKPYYKWNTFNTQSQISMVQLVYLVLNLIINGIPSILNQQFKLLKTAKGFKPYYKWNTFNTP